MKLKLLVCAFAAALLLVPFGFVRAQDGASASPPPVAQNGITLTKTAVQATPSSWNITLTVQNAGAAAPCVDVVLVADCSRSMADNASGTETSRLAAARAAALQLVDTLSAHGAPVHIGLVGFAGVARTLAPLVAVTDADGAPRAAGVQSVRAAVESAWCVADESDANGTYGVRGGTNLEQGLRCGLALLQTGSAGAKYLIVLTDDAPTVSGQQQFCDVRDTAGAPCADSPQYLPQSEILAQTSAAAQEVLSAEDLTKCFAIGFDTESVSAYASENAAYSVDAAALQSAFGHVADAMRASLQQPVVTETLGTRFSCAAASVRCSGTSGAAPGVAALQKDGAEIEWRLGDSLPAGGRATLSYTLWLADPQLEGAGRVIPVHGESMFSWAQTLPDGSVQQPALAFPCPTVLYQAGALQVVTSGLPESGSLQEQPRALVTNGAMYQLPEPDAVNGYILQAVKRNGEPVSSAELAANGWRLPMAAGETLVEYVYAPAPSAEPDAMHAPASGALPGKAPVADGAAESAAAGDPKAAADGTAQPASPSVAAAETPRATPDTNKGAATEPPLPKEATPLPRADAAVAADAAPPSSVGNLPDVASSSAFCEDTAFALPESAPQQPDSAANAPQTQAVASAQHSASITEQAAPPAQVPSPAAGAASTSTDNPENCAQSAATVFPDTAENFFAPKPQSNPPQTKTEPEPPSAEPASSDEKATSKAIFTPALPDASGTFAPATSPPVPRPRAFCPLAKACCRRKAPRCWLRLRCAPRPQRRRPRCPLPLSRLPCVLRSSFRKGWSAASCCFCLPLFCSFPHAAVTRYKRQKTNVHQKKRSQKHLFSSRGFMKCHKASAFFCEIVTSTPQKVAESKNSPYTVKKEVMHECRTKKRTPEGCWALLRFSC